MDLYLSVLKMLESSLKSFLLFYKASLFTYKHFFSYLNYLSFNFDLESVSFNYRFKVAISFANLTISAQTC